MFENQKRVEIERRVLKAGDDRARAGLPPASTDSLRLIAADELERELEAKQRARAVQRMAAPRHSPQQSATPRMAAAVARSLKLPTTPPAKPLGRPAPATKPPVPSYIAADRIRVSAIIAAAPAGAEVERDEAIASGASVEEFRNCLAARVILDARRRAGG